MKRKRKEQTNKYKIADDYSKFVYEMALAEEYYHKNDTLFNEHIKNILDIGNADYIYRIAINFRDIDYNILVVALNKCNYCLNNYSSFASTIYSFSLLKKISIDKLISLMYRYYCINSTNLEYEYPVKNFISSENHFLPLFHFCLDYINDLSDKQIGLLTSIFLKLQEYETNIITRNSNYYLIANNFPKMDVDLIASTVLSQSGVDSFLDFSIKLRNRLDINNYIDSILLLNDAQFCYKLAFCVDVSNISKIATSLIKTNNYEIMIKFAKNIYGAPINKLADEVILSDNNKYIYDFAKEVDGAPINKLAKAIIKSKDLYYINLFAKDIKDAPLDELLDTIILLGTIDDIVEFSYIEGVSIDKIIEEILKYRKKKKNLGLECEEDEKYILAIKSFLNNHKELAIEQIIPLLFQLSSKDIFNYLMNTSYNLDEMFSKIIKSSYSIYFKSYLLKDLNIKSYLFFIKKLKDIDNVSFFKKYTSIDNLFNNYFSNELGISENDNIVVFSYIEDISIDKIIEQILKYGKKKKKNIRLDYEEDQKYTLVVKNFIINRKELTIEQIIPLLFQLSSKDIFNYLMNTSYNLDEMFSKIIKSSYSIYFRLYILKDLNIKSYLYFIKKLKDIDNVSFLETYTSIDSLFNNSFNNELGILENLELLQSIILNALKIADISDVSRCTMFTILNRINEYYIRYIKENSDVYSFKIKKNKIG